MALAAVILGHHGGLPDKCDIAGQIEDEDHGRPVLNEIRGTAEADCPELTELVIPERVDEDADTDLYTRVLFSCLVDADWSDTRAHEVRWKNLDLDPDPPRLNPQPRLDRLLETIRLRAVDVCRNNSDLGETRDRILQACLTAAECPSGLFTLTVPTGGGKTLSGLAFALKHAVQRGHRRIIYVAPYLSILDQNVKVIREAIGVRPEDLDVLEHHSLADPPGGRDADEKESTQAARRAENWDAPVVVTTSVQFFESLFSNKPGRCRKLHNIAGSVILLDECQTLPPDLVKPTCQMLKQLVERLNCTIVLCTATQPAFDHETLQEHRLSATEIVPPELNLFDRLKRVQLVWPKAKDERLDWPSVAERMKKTKSALCVVNTKAAARDVFSELQKRASADQVFHLSTNMCPAHRMAVLKVVRQRLMDHQPIFVSSTQLIEAGVDVDFPAVFREMAPLEAIIQAAGRCNREGLIPNAGGRVEVFRSIEGELPRDRWYSSGRDTVETVFLAAGREPQIDNPDHIRDYFGHLYWSGNLDQHNVIGLRNGLLFETCARTYRLIDDDTVPVVVATWQEHRQEIETLVGSVRERPNRANFRKLVPFQVNMFRSEVSGLPKGFVVPIHPEIDLFAWYGKYDESIGRLPEFPTYDEGI